MSNWNNEKEAREQIKAMVAEYYHEFKEKKTRVPLSQSCTAADTSPVRGVPSSL